MQLRSGTNDQNNNINMEISIIELSFSGKSNVLILWGQNDGDDCFLLDNNQKICGFLSTDNIIHYLNNGDTLINPFSDVDLGTYKLLASMEKISYSFKEIEEIIIKNTSIEEIGAEDGGYLIEVYNLISDYFYQIDNKECLLLRKNENMEMFFDYCYYKYFWKQGNEWLELEKKMYLFDYSEFSKIYRKLVTVFIENIKIY